MAGVRFEQASGEVSITAATEAWPATVLAASNHRIKISEVDISFKGVVVTDPPVECQLAIISAVGSGGSANNPVKSNPSDDETLQTTGRKGDTSTPTIVQTFRKFKVHPQDGKTVYFDPPLEIKGGQGLSVSVNAPTSNNTVDVNIRGEE